MLTVILLLLTGCEVAKAHDEPANKNLPLKKFEVKFVVKYNAITLQEAAEKERQFKKLYKDACKVNVKITEAQNIGWTTNVIGTINDADISVEWVDYSATTTDMEHNTPSGN